MATRPSVLIIGLQPQLIDFSSPDYAAFRDLDAAKVQAALDADVAKLNSLGYDAQLCLTDFGETAEVAVSERLKQKQFDCVLIGAGVRSIGKNFFLFEKLINVVHEHAPQAKICFNTKPDDTAEAVQRWVSSASGL
jgi:hypothetical protein